MAERTIAQLERMLAVPIESAIVPVDGQGRRRGGPRARSARSSATWSTRPTPRFLEALRGDYLAGDARGARALVGTQRRRAVPDRRSAPGRRSTWTRTSVHQIGLEELETIEAERRAIARAAGFGDDTAAYRAALGRRPGQHAGVQGGAGRAGRARTSSGRWPPRRAYFGRPARGPRCEVRPVEEYKEKDAPFAYYYPPAPDGSRPGIYYANGYDLPSRKLHELATDDLPRGRPGPPLPDQRSRWRTRTSTRSAGSAPRMVGGAYVEGWGLYSERLADEMGLFRDEGERFGMLDAAGLAGGPARRRHRPPRAALAAPALDRLPAARPA